MTAADAASYKSQTKTQRRPKKRTPKKAITNHNTDVLCCDTKKASSLATLLYRINLWTGLYMLNAYERTAFQIFGIVSSLAFFAYIAVFLTGLIHGIQQAALPVLQHNTTQNPQHIGIGIDVDTEL